MSECPTRVDEYVYEETDGVFGFFLLKKGVVIPDLSFITKVVIACGTEETDSSSAPAGTIWWTDQGEYLGDIADIINFKLGNLGLPVGLRQGCRITVYDAINVNGIVYINNLNVEYVATEAAGG